MEVQFAPPASSELPQDLPEQNQPPQPEAVERAPVDSLPLSGKMKCGIGLVLVLFVVFVAAVVIRLKSNPSEAPTMVALGKAAEECSLKEQESKGESKAAEGESTLNNLSGPPADRYSAEDMRTKLTPAGGSPTLSPPAPPSFKTPSSKPPFGELPLQEPRAAPVPEPPEKEPVEPAGLQLPMEDATQPPADEPPKPAAAPRGNSSEQPPPRTYDVSEGETLFDIARRELGKASRWVEIYDLNCMILGERIHPAPGTQLLLPER